MRALLFLSVFVVHGFFVGCTDSTTENIISSNVITIYVNNIEQVVLEYGCITHTENDSDEIEIRSYQRETSTTVFVGEDISALMNGSKEGECAGDFSNAKIVLRSLDTISFGPMITTLRSLRCAGIDSVIYIATAVDSMSSVETTLILSESFCDSSIRLGGHCDARLYVDKDNSYWWQYGFEPANPFDPVVNDSLRDFLVTQAKSGGTCCMYLFVHLEAHFSQLLNVLDLKHTAERLLSNDSSFQERYWRYISPDLIPDEREVWRFVICEWTSRSEKYMQGFREERLLIIPSTLTRQSPISRITLPRYRPPVKIAAPPINAPKLIESK